VATKEDWLARLSKLRVDRGSGDCAPHKPLLLLVLCDLAQESLLPGKTIALTPEFASRFIAYWSIKAHRRSQKPDVRYPFHHLGGDKIWAPLEVDGRPSVHRDTSRLAELSPSFAECLQNPESRKTARRLLIATYFRLSEQIALYEAIGIPAPIRVEIESDAVYQSPEEARLAGREARFRIVVGAAYNYTCALTRH
jgi:putative restriction endonuclease